ncbi:MAG: PKD domain-containing protein, partial [Bacteroidales bacterium]|nr:PKD domain-containing protein [Bacteroidales bacterium]
VSESSKPASHLRKKGRLRYVEKGYLQYADSKEYFLKAGPDSPENFLAYDDFDNTPDNGGRRKSWQPHAADWNNGDPSWRNGKGTEIIGAVNYLAEQGMNAFSFITMNIDGDDKNVFPYITYTDFTRFDCSKLDQWEIVFEHASNKSMLLHFKTQEQENDQILDDGDLGILRKLYYRELIARFAHHPALEWNLGEENTQSTKQRKDMAAYIRNTDPYPNNIVLHSFPDQIGETYGPLTGNNSQLSGVSIQTPYYNVHAETYKWVSLSLSAGKPWVVANDEQNPFQIGTPVDPGYPGYEAADYDQHDIRKNTLWGNLMAGGAGVMYYFGGNRTESDMSAQDFRSRENIWKYSRIALGFFKEYLPYENMKPGDELVSEGWCFYRQNGIYAVYLKDGGSTGIELPAGSYTLHWFDPREGGSLQTTAIKTLNGGGNVNTGPPPSGQDSDWVILIRSTSSQAQNIKPVAVITGQVSQVMLDEPLTLSAAGSYDPDGRIVGYTWKINGTKEGGNEAFNYIFSEPGTYSVELIVEDDSSAFGSASFTLEIVDGEISCSNAFSQRNKVIIIEAESANLSAEWSVESQKEEFTGTGYISWTGDNEYTTPGTGVLSYPVYIETPGIYKVELRNSVGAGDDIDLHNDSWLKVEGAANFFAENAAGTRLYPHGSGKTPNPAGDGSNGWFKVYNLTELGWSWASHTDDNAPFNIFADFATRGNYTILLSARSNQHFIDRIVLYPSGEQGQAYDLTSYPVVCTDNGPPVYEAEFNITLNDNPLEDAAVNLGGSTQFTGADGSVTFMDIHPASDIPLTISYENSGLYSATLNIYGNLSKTIQLWNTALPEDAQITSAYYNEESNAIHVVNYPDNVQLYFSLYDSYGRLISKLNGYDKTLALPALQPAVYFYIIGDGTRSYSFSFAVK